MTNVVLVLSEEGAFETALSDSEINLRVLRRGTHDNEIDSAESTLEEITQDEH
jgi:hypothetical protein